MSIEFAIENETTRQSRTFPAAEKVLDSSLAAFRQDVHHRLLVNICTGQVHLSFQAELLLEVGAAKITRQQSPQSTDTIW